MSGALVRLRDVRLSYAAAAGDGASRDVLRGVDLDVAARESLAVVGPSGSGKSSLLHVAGTLLPPTSGTVELDGRDPFALDDDERARLRNRFLGFVFQAHHLLPQCSALENALVPALARPAGERAAAQERARSLLERVGLAERMTHRPAQLSGGECQRVAVVRALVNEPALLLADEPTGSLDERSADALGELLAELRDAQGVALVVVTHSERLAQRADRVLELRDGRLEPRSGAAARG